MQSNIKSAFEVLAQQPWAITPEMLELMCSIAQRENPSIEAVEAKLGRPLMNTRIVSLRDGTAVIPVTGPIFRYANLFTEISGATSLEVLARDFTTAIENPAVSRVILNFDTPGGQANGISDFAHMIRNRSIKKPVIAYAESALSAGYWIASAADQIVISKTSMVGSVGAVLAMKASKDPSLIEIVSSQSPNKRPDIRTDQGRSQIQSLVDKLAQVFIDDVAAYRGVSSAKVVSDFGQGGVRMGVEAIPLGMADRIATLEEVITGVSGSTQSAGVTAMSANVSGDQIEARKTWEADSALRDEFKTFERYWAYCRVQGNNDQQRVKATLVTPDKEQVAKALWEQDQAIRGEFKTFGAYWGYCQVINRTNKVGA